MITMFKPLTLFKCITKIGLSKDSCMHNIIRTMSIRLFEDKDHASLYATYRPTYPEGVYKYIAEYCKNGNSGTDNFNLAVDIGCGNGQSTVPLCGLFKKVIGYDVSEKQIGCAPTDIENLSFKAGPGEDLSFLENNSVDLMTIAQALHWLDLDLFYPEVRRVVKPGGVFAAYGYSTCYFEDDNADDAFMEFYRDLIGPYWNEQRKHIEDKYQSLSHPFKNWKRVVNDDLKIHRSMPIDAFVGYLSTMSAWRSYLKQHPESDGLDQVRKKFETIYNDKNVDVYWTVFMLIGRKDA